MSSTSGICNCADHSQCKKKGNGYAPDILETEKSCFEDNVMEVPAAEMMASASVAQTALALIALVGIKQNTWKHGSQAIYK